MLSQRSTWDFPELKVGPKMILAPETKLIKLKNCHWSKLVDMTLYLNFFPQINEEEKGGSVSPFVYAQ